MRPVRGISMEARVTQAALRGLLRVFRSGVPADMSTVRWNLDRADTEAVSVWWALSPAVTRLAERVLHHPREITTVSEPEERVTPGEISGAVNAGATVIHQITTADPSAFVVAESFETYMSGPNRVLAITLAEAWHVLDAAARVSDIIARAADEQLRLLESAMRVAGVREVLAASGGRRRITPYERRQTAKTHSYLYRLAYDAAVLLEGVRALDATTLDALFREALLPKLEVWRQFELACLLEAALSLSKAIGEAVTLDLAFTSGRPAATIGPFTLFWQYGVQPRESEDLDPGERMARHLAASLGVQPGTRKADVAVERKGALVALIECKWFQTEADAPSAIADASEQLVAYARDHVAKYGGDVTRLLSDSIVALAYRGAAPLIGPGSPVGCVGFEDIERGALDAWALHLAASAPMPVHARL